MRPGGCAYSGVHNEMSDAPSTSLLDVIATDELPDLGPGPRPGVLPAPELLGKVDAWLAERKYSPRTARLFRAAALLWHDHHAAAHAIVQDDPSAEASFLHAILHRREPDQSNACYWWRRVGRHPVFVTLAKRVGEYLEGDEFKRWRDLLLPNGVWDPEAFVDATYICHPREYTYPLFQHIQRLEMECLLDYLRRRG
jgi:hypothetical protein